jgi:uridine phosphorylase
MHVVNSPRQLNAYFGKFKGPGGDTDIAIVSSGMGCPSMDIVLGELISLGAKRFLRIGTAGSLQAKVHYGHFVIAQGAVRDEGTTRHYAPIEFPALADANMVNTLQDVLRQHPNVQSHTGIVHCKDSLHAREFGIGPQAAENKRYLEILRDCGVLASEMETASLFVRTAIAAAARKNQETRDQDIKLPRAAALLAIIGDDEPFSDRDHTDVTNTLVSLGLCALSTLHQTEQQQIGLSAILS